MKDRARRGLEAFLARKAPPAVEEISEIEVAGRILPLRLRRHPTAKRLILRLSPDGSEARVSLPRWAPFDQAESFARSRREWLATQLRLLPEKTAVEPGAALTYRGRSLTVGWAPDHSRTVRREGNRLIVGGPRQSLERRVLRWLEVEALRLFQRDCAEFCQRAGCAVPPVRLSRARRRWGSCAAAGTLRINWRLAMAPDAVRRSVVAHEVAHLVHFDHSPRFHALLATIADPDVAEADRWLARHGRGLYAPFG